MTELDPNQHPPKVYEPEIVDYGDGKPNPKNYESANRSRPEMRIRTFQVGGFPAVIFGVLMGLLGFLLITVGLLAGFFVFLPILAIAALLRQSSGRN